MKKLLYNRPETVVVKLHLSSPITLDDLFTASQEEENKDPYAGAKEMGDISVDVEDEKLYSNPNLWDGATDED